MDLIPDRASHFAMMRDFNHHSVVNQIKGSYRPALGLWTQRTSCVFLATHVPFGILREIDKVVH